MKTILAVNELTPQKKKGIMFVVFVLGLVQNFSSNMFNTTGTAIVAQLSGVEYYTLQFTIFTLVSGMDRNWRPSKLCRRIANLSIIQKGNYLWSKIAPSTVTRR